MIVLVDIYAEHFSPDSLNFTKALKGLIVNSQYTLALGDVIRLKSFAHGLLPCSTKKRLFRRCVLSMVKHVFSNTFLKKSRLLD